jgi:hypothetical protein
MMIVHLGLTLPVLRGLDSARLDSRKYITVLYSTEAHHISFVMIALEMMCCVGRC